MYGNIFYILGIINGIFVVCQGFECHDDPAFEPEEGPLTDIQFSWLGALQYIHVKEGTPHYFRVPRASLIARQFALSIAKDVAEVPDGYALGNVVFGEYERDENECQVTLNQIAKGHRCDAAVLLMPIADVLLHPEYKHFGVKSSIALLKLLTPVKSRYMLPACLPYKNFLARNGKEVNGLLIYVDFVSEVPRDFVEEEKEVLFLRKLSTDKCLDSAYDEETSRLPANRYICTTGCDFQSGGPSVIHEHTGHWNILAISEGGPPCPDPLRSRSAAPPSRHLLLHPYVPWITTAISGKAVGAYAKDDPFGYIMPRAFAFPKRIKGWVGRWWLGGVRCYDRGDAAADIYRFYHEIFEIKPDITRVAQLIYYLEIHSAHSLYIVCVKVGMPYQMMNPIIWGINTFTVKMRIPLFTLKRIYRIVVEAYCNNGTIPIDVEGSEEESEEYDESSSEDEASDEYIGYDEELHKMGKPRPRKKPKGDIKKPEGFPFPPGKGMPMFPPGNKRPPLPPDQEPPGGPGPKRPGQNLEPPQPGGPEPEGPAPEGPGPEGPGQKLQPPQPGGPGPEGPGPKGPVPEGPGPKGPVPEGPGPKEPVPEGPGPKGPGPEGPGPEGSGPKGPGGKNSRRHYQAVQGLRGSERLNDSLLT